MSINVSLLIFMELRLLGRKDILFVVLHYVLNPVMCDIIFSKLKVTMQNKDERAWMLHNVLGAAHLSPVSKIHHRADNGLYPLIKEPNTPELPSLIGKVHALALPNCAGLPSHLTIEERKAVNLAINASLTNQLIEWEAPVVVASQMTLTVENRQEPEHTGKRLAKLILRALPKYQGKPAFDNIKVLVEEDHSTKYYFGRCLLFFQDNSGSAFVAIRWYTNASPNETTIDPTVGLVRLKLAPLNNVTRANIHGSVSILPAGSIHNGASVIPFHTEYFSLQSSTEQDRYVQM